MTSQYTPLEVNNAIHTSILQSSKWDGNTVSLLSCVCTCTCTCTCIYMYTTDICNTWRHQYTDAIRRVEDWGVCFNETKLATLSFRVPLNHIDNDVRMQQAGATMSDPWCQLYRPTCVKCDIISMIQCVCSFFLCCWQLLFLHCSNLSNGRASNQRSMPQRILKCFRGF